MLHDARDDILAFCGFPPKHWRQIWSTNPIVILSLRWGVFDVQHGGVSSSRVVTGPDQYQVIAKQSPFHESDYHDKMLPVSCYSVEIGVTCGHREFRSCAVENRARLSAVITFRPCYNACESIQGFVLERRASLVRRSVSDSRLCEGTNPASLGARQSINL